MVVDDMVARFDVFDKELGIVVGNGLGAGSNKKEVVAIYPNTIVSPHPYIAPEGEYLEVKLNNGNGIIFETDHDIVTSFRFVVVKCFWPRVYSNSNISFLIHLASN
ncbi:hypothetical protein ACUNWE_18785, partial [Alteromonas sp. 1036]